MTVSREIKTAVLVLLGILLIIFTFNYLKGQNLLDSSRKFYVVYDNIEGLTLSSPVTINGFIVGKIQDISFNAKNDARLKVTLTVDNDFKFSKNSKAELYETGLIGGKAIAIVPVFDDAEEAKNGDVLNASVKKGLLQSLDLTSLQLKLEGMVVSADSVLTSVNSVLDEGTKANLRSTITQLNATIASFNTTSQSLSELIENNKGKLDSTLTNVNTLSGNLVVITDSLANAGLSGTIKNLEATIGNFNNVLSSIDRGEGTLGKLVKDEALYNNLENATKELEELLEDIKLHPKRYFRILSKKEIPYQEN